MPSGYENIYLKLVPRLAACDFAESAERLGMEITREGHIQIPFLGRTYLVTKEGARPVDGGPVDVNNLSVLLYYVLSGGCGQPKHSFVPLLRMTGVLEGQWGQSSDLMQSPLVREFGGDYGKFREAALHIGGTCVEESAGKHEWAFLLLPKIPAKVIFYEADEEFPAEVQILLDETAPRFLEFECLAFLSGCFVGAMVQSAQDGRRNA